MANEYDELVEQTFDTFNKYTDAIGIEDANVDRVDPRSSLARPHVTDVFEITDNADHSFMSYVTWDTIVTTVEKAGM